MDTKQSEFLKSYANAIRALSIDMVNEASSGHQGTPLGFADVVSVLFNEIIDFAPGKPDRDRLILSAGHASPMLYAAIYLTQKTPLSLDELRNFRKFGSRCQGHPKLDKDIGIEMTTGALGQGIATAVGFAIALKKKKLDSKVYVIVGDGCLMEGVSHEAMTLASKLNLNNLIVLFDNNNVVVDGFASDFTTPDVTRFTAYGFEVIEANGHDYYDIRVALNKAKNATKPVFASFKTRIGYPAEKCGTNACHSRFISKKDAKKFRKDFGFSETPFEIPNAILWKGSETAVQETKYEINKDKLHTIINKIKNNFVQSLAATSTREPCGTVFGELCQHFSNIIGGAADLSHSTSTISEHNKIFTSPDFSGDYINYSIREHAMGCAMNGLAIEGFIPYGGTYLVFSDYMRPAIRNAALMGIAPIFVLTHDSVALGEDGVTHQPVEQLSSLRLMPNLNVMRPSCSVEVAECIELAVLNRKTPTALVLSRQKVENVRETYIGNNLCEKGMYELVGFASNGREKTTIIATGSEVTLAMNAKNELKNFDIRIISAPCLELFDKQPEEYKRSILSNESGRRLFIEAGSPDIWHKYKTRESDVIWGISQFGESGTTADLFEKFGFTVENIKKLIEQ
ncbi:MAG: transketolase [Alphaproteobacteria bacterium]|nr:transketolase [Alphaproteobacteria bacterium]